MRIVDLEQFIENLKSVDIDSESMQNELRRLGLKHYGNPMPQAWMDCAQELLRITSASRVTLAAIGHNHFGNPIPQWWYAAAAELVEHVDTIASSEVPAAPSVRDRNRLG